MKKQIFIPLRVLLPLLSLLSLFGTLSAAGTLPSQVSSHHISMNFEMETRTLHATSRIFIPPDNPLSLYTGHLTVTGAVLEPANRTPVTVMKDSSGQIHIPGSPVPQNFYLSWRFRPEPTRGGVNLISNQGITLAGFWHPTSDREMIYSIEATLPKGFTGVTEAEEITTVQNRNSAYTKAFFNHPLSNIHFIAGPYEVRKRKHAGIDLYAYFFTEDSTLAEGYLDKTAHYLDLYQELIGPYPYTRYAVVENRLPTGYGMPTFTLLGQAVVRLPFIKDTSLGHEVLHSWFGNSVFVSTPGGNWSEGLTTYLADYYYKELKGEGADYRKKQLLRYQTSVKNSDVLPLGKFINTSRNHVHSRKIRAVGYDKSSLFFHMLRRNIADEAFFAGLKTFYTDNRFKQAGRQELLQAFSKNTSTDLSSFFSQWFDRTDTPRLSAENIKIKQKAGQSVLTFDLTQHTETPYQLDLTIEVATMGGSIQQTINTETKVQPVVITTAALPVKMVIDPYYDTMRILGQDELPPIWSAYLGSPNKKILVAKDVAPIHEMLINIMKQQGATLLFEDTVKNSDLLNGDWLFIGDTGQRRALFAGRRETPAGFHLDVRKNPLNLEQVIVTVDSASQAETDLVARKLMHYGQYSTLYFTRGKIAEKETRFSKDGIHYRLLQPPSGIPVAPTMSFDEIVKRLRKSRVIYIGETHTDYGAHLLQLQVIQALHSAGEKFIIGMEMFPRTSQEALDDYINGTIDSEKVFLNASSYFNVWGFDYRLYRDIIAFAKANTIPLVGLNLDKEITRTLFRKGSTDSLTETQHKSIPAERDLSLPGYSERLLPVFSQHASPHSNSGFAGFIQAQALWDETMAETIARTLEAHPEFKMVIIAGNGHVHKTNGIPPRVARRLPGTTQQVVLPQPLSGSLSNSREAADYLIPTEPMTMDPAAKIGVILTETTTNRVRIEQISPHGKAGQGGLEAGDVILGINRVKVATIVDVKFALLESAPGDFVEMEIERNGCLLKLQVELTSIAGMTMPPGHPKVKKGQR